MYSKQNKILTVSLMTLIAMAAGVYVAEIGYRTEPIRKDIYKVPDTAEVNEVRLQSNQSNVVLKYNGTRWKVNNKYDADRQLITVLFATLKEAESKRLIAAIHRDSIRRQIRAEGVLVSLFKGQRKVKEFYLAGNSEHTKTYFMDAENGPHLVTIPGYRIYIAGIFELGELDWISRRIFDFNWRSFKRLSSTLSIDEEQRVVIDYQEEKVLGVAGLTKTDTAKLYDYLNALSILEADRFIPAGGSKHYDSLAQTTPVAQIAVTDAENNIYNLTVYPFLAKDKSILGKKSGNIMALFQRKKITPLLRSRNYFILKQQDH